MIDMFPRLRSSVVIALGLAVAVQVSAQQRYSKLEADRCETKIGRINAFANGPKAKTTAAATTGAGQTTQLTDAELNAYLRYHLKDQVPAGIVEPTLNALGDGRVGGVAVIDLDAVRKQRQRGWMDPLNYLSGSLPLTASGVLVTQNGVGRFQLESAAISGISIPKSLLQELLTYYSKSPQNPAGISIDDPFALPARIKEIRVGKGEAMVVQ
jgi:hypothetical protein